MDPRWKHPFTAVISGPTKSGKTYFVERFISNIDYIMYPRPMEIVWCYGEWQLSYENLKRQGVIFIEGIPDTDLIGNRTRWDSPDNPVTFQSESASSPGFITPVRDRLRKKRKLAKSSISKGLNWSAY